MFQAARERERGKRYKKEGRRGIYSRPGGPRLGYLQGSVWNGSRRGAKTNHSSTPPLILSAVAKRAPGVSGWQVERHFAEKGKRRVSATGGGVEKKPLAAVECDGVFKPCR